MHPVELESAVHLAQRVGVTAGANLQPNDFAEPISGLTQAIGLDGQVQARFRTPVRVRCLYLLVEQHRMELAELSRGQP